MNGSPRVFVVRMSAIGDVVMTTRAIANLRAQGLEPVLVTSPGLADVARCMVPLRYFVTIDGPRLEVFEKLVHSPRGHAISLRTLLQPEGVRLPLSALDLQRTSRSRRARSTLKKACLQTGSSFTVTTLVAKNTLLRAWLVLWAFVRSLFLKQQHRPLSLPKNVPNFMRANVHSAQEKAVQSHLSKLKWQPSARLTPTLPLPQDTRLFHAEPLAEGTPLTACGSPLVGKRYVCFVPGASGPVKQWPKENFRALANLLLKETSPGGIDCVVVLGGGNERALGHYLASAPENRSRDVRDATGTLSLWETFRILENAAHVFTNDTFASHVADLSDVPFTLFFGGTTPAFGFLPLSRKATLLYENLACSPCTRHGLAGCRYANLRCLQTISAEKAFRTIACDAKSTEGTAAAEWG
ncbi:MAG: glycosyltransferase family 9 protein [Silvanigrellales bacterium]|nr:glycosyltransferase family 9 protein [Silvanigrellales bacterium]